MVWRAIGRGTGRLLALMAVVVVLALAMPEIVRMMTPTRLAVAHTVIAQIWWPATALRLLVHALLAWGFIRSGSARACARWRPPWKTSRRRAAIRERMNAGSPRGASGTPVPRRRSSVGVFGGLMGVELLIAQCPMGCWEGVRHDGQRHSGRLFDPVRVASPCLDFSVAGGDRGGALSRRPHRVRHRDGVRRGQGSGPEAGARSLIIRLAIYMLVLVLGLIPIVPLHLTAIQVQNQCAREGLATLGQKVDFINNNEYGFGEVQDARVPLLPYLAMILASGFNAVMNQAIPCVQDLTNLSLAMNTVNFSEAENPAALRAAIDRFEQECGQRAQRIAVGFLSGEYGDRFQKYMEELLNQYADNEAERRVQLAYFGSRFYRENFIPNAAVAAIPTRRRASCAA